MKKTTQLDFTNQLAHIVVSKTGEREIITKSWGKAFGWTFSDAQQVIEMHRKYVFNLHQVGIKTSTNLEEKVVSGENGEYLVQSTEEYFTQADLLANLMKSCNQDVFVEKVQEYISLSAKLLFSIPPLRQKQYSLDWLWLSVPIDLKPQNAVLSESRLVLVDTFRPQLWGPDSLELMAMPSIHVEKQKIPFDEIKTGDIRFQAGRLFGYFVAIGTRWLMNQGDELKMDELDFFRHRIANNAVAIVTELLTKNEMFSDDLANVLITDVKEVADESLSVGSYEGPRYVQTLYEKEERERLIK